MITGGSFSSQIIPFESAETESNNNLTVTGSTISVSNFSYGLDFRLKYHLDNFYSSTNVLFANPNLSETLSSRSASHISNLGFLVGYKF